METAQRLLVDLFRGERGLELMEVLHAFFHGFMVKLNAVKFLFGCHHVFSLLRRRVSSLCLLGLRLQSRPVLEREHLHEPRAGALPVREEVLREGGARVIRVLLDEALQDLFVRASEVPGLGVRGAALFVRPFNPFQRDHRGVAVAFKVAVRVKHISDAARHA